MKISLILAVKNDEATIGALLDSVAAQTRQPDEIVIVDGGSSDRTRSLIESHPLQVRLETLAGNASACRNRAVELAQGELIAVTEPGCTLDPAWLEAITALNGADVVAGVSTPVVASLFDACQACVTGASQSGDLEFSSRSLAFLKVVWQELGGYPEWLEHCGDAWFKDMILQSRFSMRQEPGAVARHRQDPDAKSVFKRFYRSTQSDGRTLKRTKSHLIRLGAYAAGLEMLLMGLWRPGWFLPVILGFAAYLYRPVNAFRAMGSYPLTAKAVGMMAGLALAADAGRIAGYLSGLKNAHELPPGAPKRPA